MAQLVIPAVKQEMLEPKYDILFKNIFGSEENKNEVLLNFVNEVLRVTQSKPFVELTLMKTTIDKKSYDDKGSVLDLVAKTEDGEIVNIEIQLKNKDMMKRTFFYLGDLYTDQLHSGEAHEILKKTTTINILDFIFIQNDLVHNPYQPCNIYTGDFVTNIWEVHFLELPKLKNLDQETMEKNKRLICWLRWIAGAPPEEWEELAMDTPGLKKAMSTLEYLSQDEEVRAIAKAQMKAIRDRASEIAHGKEEGRQEGRQEGIEVGREQGIKEGKKEGRKEGIEEVAKKLLKKQASITEIVELTDMTEAEILKLKHEEAKDSTLANR